MGGAGERILGRKWLVRLDKLCPCQSLNLFSHDKKTCCDWLDSCNDLLHRRLHCCFCAHANLFQKATPNRFNCRSWHYETYSFFLRELPNIVSSGECFGAVAEMQIPKACRIVVFGTDTHNPPYWYCMNGYR